MLSDPRFHAREVVNRQIHAIQQNARDNDAPFGFYGGGPKRAPPRAPRAPRNRTPYKLRGTNTRRITAETTLLRNEMPSRTVIRNRLVAAFRARGLEQVPYELIDISAEIIKSLTAKNANLLESVGQPRFATEYFVPTPRKPRAPKRVLIEAPVLEPVLAPVVAPKTGMTDAHKKKMKEGREKALLRKKQARMESERLRRKRADMNARAIRYSQGLE